MNYSKIKFLLLLALIVFSASCSRLKPIYDYKDAPIPDGLTMEQISKAIKLGGVTRGWLIKNLKEGVMEGQLNLREHEAVILIEFDTSKYSVQYLSSKNLMYEGGDKPRIHRNYNSWIQNLREDITRELIKASI